MANAQPQPISSAEERRRLRRVSKIARSLGFVGRIEYRHAVSGTGGGQFRGATESPDDLLIVDAQAFARDLDPDDFSLEAIIAHERGHQLVFRRPVLRRMMNAGISAVSEEILASLIGSIISRDERDRQTLHGKAVYEAIQHGMNPDHAVECMFRLRKLLELAL